MKPERWEQGSEFAWPRLADVQEEAVGWFEKASRLGSGRDALRWLLGFGRLELGWKRLWVPSYFCQEVVAAIARAGIPLAAYSDGPGFEASELKEATRGDAVLRVKYFGLKPVAALRLARGVTRIEDHSHDPVAADVEGSDADFVVASLRKTLPIPDGALVWSPIGRELPTAPGVSRERLVASGARHAGMALKSLYLDGLGIEKDAYRSLFGEGEARIARGKPSGMTPLSSALLSTFPVRRWRRLRQRNFREARRVLRRCRGLRVLEPSANCCPFSVLCECETESVREGLRMALIEARVFPAVLWPMERPFLPRDQRAIALSRKVLSVHCDFRYSREDLAKVTRLMATSLRSLGA